jgi:rod shape-determining protein MreD
VRRPLLVLGCGLAAVVLQGGLAAMVPVQWVPDLGLVAVIAAALVLGPAEGLLVAALVGFACDALSGALLGQHACLRLLELLLVRVLAQKLDLRGPLTLAVGALALALLDALGMALLTRLFLGDLALPAGQAARVLLRAAVTALAAPFGVGAVRGLVERLDVSEARREMRLDTRRPAL